MTDTTDSLSPSAPAPPSFAWQDQPTSLSRVIGYHAHFDCFSGAAGDMMLAACLDSAGDDRDALLAYVIHCLRSGLPEMKEEFDIRSKRVWRGMGSISGWHVHVISRYHHEPAPVPEKAGARRGGNETATQLRGGDDENGPHNREHEHEHSHLYVHNHEHSHSHSHSHEYEDDHKHENHHSLSLGKTSTPEEEALKQNSIPSASKTDDQSKIRAQGEDNREHSHSHIHKHPHSHSHDREHSHSHGRTHHHGHSNSRGHEHEHEHGHGHEHEHSHEHGGSPPRGPLRNLPQIRKMLEDAPDEFVAPWVRSAAIAAFSALADAEARTHGAETRDDVHFHEVGAIDSIVDTVGTLVALHALGVRTVSCSRLPMGEGTVWTDHGLLPVPAPATLHLMVGMPTCPGPPGTTGELVTPTGAALLRTLVRDHGLTPDKPNLAGRPPHMTIRTIGIGAGTRNFEKHANILRLLIGDVLDTNV